MFARAKESLVAKFPIQLWPCKEDGFGQETHPVSLESEAFSCSVGKGS
jgi:hypothetical protein